MLTFDEARNTVMQHACSFGKEQLKLDDAYGRVLNMSVKADRDYPPFDRASMDGYAIKKSDWDSGRRSFTIKETIYAGGSSLINIETGECYKIMTGAAVPAAADVVVRREDVQEKNEMIFVELTAVKSFQNIARRGEDIKKDILVFDKPMRCTPPLMGLLASLGYGTVMVERLPRVAIVTTGDEVVGVNDMVNAVQIRNSNVCTIKALLKKWDITPNAIMHVPDDKQKLIDVIKAAVSNDIIITTGGVSAGDADYVPGILAQCGVQQLFHKVAIKPGKPFLFGKFVNGATVFALPGNPLSCMVTFKLFVDLFLSCSFGLNKPEVLSIPFEGKREKKSLLDEFFPVKLSGTPSVASAMQFNGSGDITAIVEADGVARHSAVFDTINTGMSVEVYRIS